MDGQPRYSNAFDPFCAHHGERLRAELLLHPICIAFCERVCSYKLLRNKSKKSHRKWFKLLKLIRFLAGGDQNSLLQLLTFPIKEGTVYIVFLEGSVHYRVLIVSPNKLGNSLPVIKKVPFQLAGICTQRRIAWVFRKFADETL